MTEKEFRVCKVVFEELDVSEMGGVLALDDSLRDDLCLDSLEIAAILIKLDIKVEDPTTLVTVQDLVDQCP